MIQGELFDSSELKQNMAKLDSNQKVEVVGRLAQSARLGERYFYTAREAGQILHLTRDEMSTLISRYRLDAVLFLSAYRIPWYDICGFLLDDDDDLEEALNEYLQAIARRDTSKCRTR
jgi:hypothetical protein